MKSIGRPSKPPRDRSPERKMPPMRKPGPPRSPPRGSNRSLVSRGHSPSMKHRPPPHLRKPLHHSSRPPVMTSRRSRSASSHGSPVPMDRMRAPKYLKKRKPYSRSPPQSRRMSISPRKHLSPPPHGGRARNGSMPSPEFDGPKKKLRREPLRISPSQRPPDKSIHMHPDNRIPHRSVGIPESIYGQDRGRDYSSAQPSVRPLFSSAGPSREGYSLNSSDRSRPGNFLEASYSRGREREDYISEREKQYGQTLDERFKEAARGQEHRIQFSRSDLENITIDVKRGMRDTSPTLRRILNPSEVKLVRRPLEGHRPIFDREEIKHSPRDLREDPYNERKYSSGQNYGLNYKELENYEITRHKFDTYRGPPLPAEGAYTLGEKWQRYETRKASSPSLDREERPPGYARRSRSPGSFLDKSHLRRSRSADREFRNDRYPSGGVDHRPRPAEYSESRRPLPNDPSDLRHSLAVKRKDGTLHDARQRILERRNSGGHDRPPSAHGDYRHYPGPSRRPPESSSDRIRERRSMSPVRRMEPSRSRRESSYIRERSVDRGRPREDKVSEYSQRPDRYKYPSWSEKPEHDDREGSTGYRGRSSSRGYRGRGFRRPFRGPIRGGFRGRGTFRGISSPRGRGGYAPRRGRRYSPNLWKHDLYDKVSPDH